MSVQQRGGFSLLLLLLVPFLSHPFPHLATLVESQPAFGCAKCQVSGPMSLWIVIVAFQVEI